MCRQHHRGVAGSERPNADRHAWPDGHCLPWSLAGTKNRAAALTPRAGDGAAARLPCDFARMIMEKLSRPSTSLAACAALTPPPARYYPPARVDSTLRLAPQQRLVASVRRLPGNVRALAD